MPTPNKASSRLPAGREATRRRPVRKETLSADPSRSYGPSVPMVGIGASAGGLDAITALLAAVGSNTGMAFVIAQHLDPTYPHALAEVLVRATDMPVTEISNEAQIERDRVYIIPPQKRVRVSGNALFIIEEETKTTSPMPIDYFLRSLAENHQGHAIGVILSGNATDGGAGLAAIKGEGGITFAQDETAKYPSMPRNAIALNAADMVAPPGEIGREIARLAEAGFPLITVELSEGSRAGAFRKVFSLLHSRHGVDFSHYKPSTVERRVRRRMVITRTETIENYLQLLEQNRAEVDALYQDMLIRVTGFFRDPAVFDYVKEEIFRPLIKDHDGRSSIRVWVPGCATGEEVYSIAILLTELLTEAGSNIALQIFGTDVSDAAIERARAGIYPQNIEADVSPERLRRYFAKIDGQYRLSKMIRDSCIFARQNLTRDPPFSRLDLISCRNVLIYLGQVLQLRSLSVFHYSLKPNGHLVLGNSESVGKAAALFRVVDRHHKIFQKIDNGTAQAVDFSFAERELQAVDREGETHPPAVNLFREADRVALARYAPAGVLVNDAMQILQFRGKTGPYLEAPSGAATLHVLKMAREGILADLRNCLQTARKELKPWRRENIEFQVNGQPSRINIDVTPFVPGGGRERFYIVSFEAVALPESQGKKRRAPRLSAQEERQLERLKRELEATREYLQSIIEEQEATNEELRSANEEIQSSNEELQSTNEELETAKEELQSSNEELTTLNEELENRNQDLGQLYNDIQNLLNSVDIPILMLGADMRIRRYNPLAQRVLRLIPSDIGRPVGDLRTRLKLDNLEDLVREVIDTLRDKELHVEDHDGGRYLLRIRPYKTADNRIEGAVIAAIDVELLLKPPAIPAEAT